jgi:uncharacterized membrane protein YhaH (DUF805 family)
MRWLLFSGSGRVTRKTFMLAVAFWFVVLAIPLTMAARVTQGAPAQAIIGLAIVFSFALSCFSILMVAMKRVRDIGLPGPVAFAILVPVLSFVALIALCALPSSPGPNRFGPGPDRPGY